MYNWTVSKQDLRSKFLKTYANIPLAARKEIVLVYKGEPLSWNACKIEVQERTPTGKEILSLLTKLKII